jgi:hypothetical protein
MKKFFPPTRNFKSLSVKDLLDAREAYHTHLAHLENVVATAIGPYRIRVKDPDFEKPLTKDTESHSSTTPRTLHNTVVRPWSWPCLLVFVDRWLTREELSREAPGQLVPPLLYMPDGRVVPTCVIYVEVQEEAPPPLLNINFPEEMIGGGYPIFTDVQGQPHIGSLGCLVTDGDSVYALTNRHVTGEPGRVVNSFFRGEGHRIGFSDKTQIGKKLFKEVYPGWAGSRDYANLDAGLIHVDDVKNWTAQVFGIGEIGEPVDLNTDTISLDLIGCPVRAFGAASGELVGEIQALFYRYKSIGGFDYVSDLLIGPRFDVKTKKSIPLNTLPGDSGTVWFFDNQLSQQEAKEEGLAGERARRLRPLALQWGGHVLMGESGEATMRFALATNISTLCRELDVDIVRGWNIGHNEYWGKVGHYKIAAKACELVSNAKLKKLLKNNLDAIAFTDADIAAGNLPKMQQKNFIALADVPDLAWRGFNNPDDANHFADMDQKGVGDEFKGKTLLELCEDPANLDINLWNRFYDSLGTKPEKRGALPFRVWHIYNQMVEFVKQGKLTEFVFAGGVLSHYVGDACQPLHISQFHHGRPGMNEDGVHSKYETDMLEQSGTRTLAIIADINEALKTAKGKSTLKGGKGAALEVVRLMRNTVTTLPPLKIIKVFNDTGGNLTKMFDALRKDTITCMADGCVTLASLWASAWREGGGSAITADQLGAVDKGRLQTFYKERKLIPAFIMTNPKFAQQLT